MAVTKKTVGSKSPKSTAKGGSKKVAATKITTSSIHTTSAVGPGT